MNVKEITKKFNRLIRNILNVKEITKKFDRLIIRNMIYTYWKLI